MKIERNREYQGFKEKNRALGNCFIVDEKYYYEFEIHGYEALVICDNLEYIEEVIDEFRFYNKYITIFYNKDHTFYKEFDKVFTFKLPISCIQPSQFFIDEDKLAIIEKYMDEDEVYIPVKIINDEYVSLDGHTRLYFMHQNYAKLVNVYLDDADESINDFVYIAKENNISKISSMQLLTHEEYDKLWNGFCEDYYNNKE